MKSASTFRPASNLEADLTYFWRVRAFNAGGTVTDWSASRNFITSAATQVPAPSITPAGTVFDREQTVTMVCDCEGASVYYTVDGTTPSPTNGTLYAAPFSITDSKVVKAIGVKLGMKSSPVSQQSYTYKGTVPAPAITPAGKVFETSQVVTITCAWDGASVYFTTNGTTPSANNGTLYAAPFAITASCTVKAVGIKAGMTDSPVSQETYTLKGSVSSPLIVAPEPPYANDFSVSFTCATLGATIRYTLDGSDPLAGGSTVFTAASGGSVSVTGAVTVQSGADRGKVTVRAAATAEGMLPSGVELRTFTLQCAAPSVSSVLGAGNPSVTIASGTIDAGILYTIGTAASGVDPTTLTAPNYAGAFQQAPGTVVRAAARKAGYADSTVTVYEVPALPTPVTPTVTAGDGLLSVSWTAVDGATSYEIYWNTSSTPAGNKISTTSATGTITGLSNGTTYYVWVRAFNTAGGTSEYSPQASGKPFVYVSGVTLDKTTVSLTVGGTESLSATVSPSNATDKSVTWSSDPGAVATVSQTGLVTAVSPGTATITVETNDSHRKATSAVTVFAAAQPPAAPGAPTVTTGDAQLSVNWSAVSGATSYEVYWNTSDYTATIPSPWVTVTTGTAATITGLTNGTTYWVWVKAKNASGTSGFSTSSSGRPFVYVSGVTLNKTTSSLAVGATETLSATVTPSNATNKTVSWTTSASLIATVSSSGYVTAVSPGTATITASATDGSSNTSAVCNVSVYALLAAPAAPSVTAGDTQLSVSWSAVSGATGYDVFWHTSNNTSTIPVGNRISTASASATITGLTNGTTYYVWIKATNTNTTSGFSPSSSDRPFVYVSSFSLNQSSVTLTSVGATAQLNAVSVLPLNATNKNVTWESSNTSVATVNSTGLVTAVNTGTARITATAADNGTPVVAATCDVTVNLTVGLGINFTDPAHPTLSISGSIPLNRGVNQTMDVNATGGFVSYTWVLDGRTQYPDGFSLNGSGSSVTILSQHITTLGTHELMVTVKDGTGKFYSARVYINVVQN